MQLSAAPLQHSLVLAGNGTEYRDRTWQLPYGVFAQGMGIAMLPSLSSNIAKGEVDEYKNTLIKGIKTVLFFTIPSGVGFIVLKEP